MKYKTTSLFLESFGLNSLDDLPELELEPGQPLELNLLRPGAATGAGRAGCGRGAGDRREKRPKTPIPAQE